jgi:hypothetical protein
MEESNLDIHQQVDHQSQQLDSSNPNDISKIKKKYLIAVIVFCLGLAISAFIIFFSPISNYLIIRNANPAMISLAQQAGMSREGELVFLRSKPQIVSDIQMEKDCAANAAANNRNGFIEQGCFVPSRYNNANGRIYIRKMPPNLYDQEIVTAAYEMLHSVYFNIASTNKQTSLIQAIEANYNNINSHTLNTQVINFAKTEPNYRDLELFSLLGTEYSNLSKNLTNFYAPYFNDRLLTVDNYNNITSIFKNEQNQLSQIQTTITNDNNEANKAYADSLAWAKIGNSYEDAYNYNIYKNYIAQENSAINRYNQLNIEYNTLVTEYNGNQPVNSLKNVQPLNSK